MTWSELQRDLGCLEVRLESIRQHLAAEKLTEDEIQRFGELERRTREEVEDLKVTLAAVYPGASDELLEILVGIPAEVDAASDRIAA